MTAREGSYVLGAASCVSSILGIYVLKLFKRRSLLVPGHFIMGLCNILVGTFIIKGYNELTLLMMILFIFAYQTMNGILIWVYITELVVDSALGLIILTLWSFTLLFALTTNYMMESALQPQGTFFLFGSLSCCGGFFTLFFAKETVGLNDKEKKMVYSP